MVKEKLVAKKKRFKDSLKASLKQLNIAPDTWESLATDRTKWRNAVTTGAHLAENTRKTKAEEKRDRRKSKEKATCTLQTNPDTTAILHECNICKKKQHNTHGSYRTHRTST